MVIVGQRGEEGVVVIDSVGNHEPASCRGDWETGEYLSAALLLDLQVAPVVLIVVPSNKQEWRRNHLPIPIPLT